MKTTESKVALACFVSAFIGLIVAFTIHHFFWWVGMLVGGLVGYLSYNLREVWDASRHVWRSLASWRCDWNRLRGAMVDGCYFVAFVSTPLTLFFLIPAMDIPLVIATITILIFFSVGMALSYGIPLPSEAKNLAKRINIVSASCWIVYGFIKGTAKCAEQMPKAVMFVCRFVKGVFILVHSDIRLLCGVDAALGVLAGRIAGQGITVTVPVILAVAVFSGIVGALLGVLNYRLVSIRWLKLVPAKP